MTKHTIFCERRLRGRVRAEPSNPRRTKAYFRFTVSIDRSTHPPSFIRRARCHTNLGFPVRCKLIQCHHVTPALSAWAGWTYYTLARTVATQFPVRGCIMTSRSQRSFDSEATWAIGVLGLFFDMQFMRVCAVRHWQTSG